MQSIPKDCKVTVESQEFMSDYRLTTDQQRAHTTAWILRLQRKNSDMESRLSSMVSLLTKEAAKTTAAEEKLAQLEKTVNEWVLSAQSVILAEREKTKALEQTCANLEARLLLLNATSFEQY